MLQSSTPIPATLTKCQIATDDTCKRFKPLQSARPVPQSLQSSLRRPTTWERECNDMDYGAGNETRPDVEEPQGEDRYQVRWDNGDEDPMNPRSMTLLRKWVVVSTVSASSLCV
jgi:hypothetical protein